MKEAVRKRAPAIDLVDGDLLVEKPGHLSWLSVLKWLRLNRLASAVSGLRVLSQFVDA